jgi:hypothetical protein
VSRGHCTHDGKLTDVQTGINSVADRDRTDAISISEFFGDRAQNITCTWVSLILKEDHRVRIRRIMITHSSGEGRNRPSAWIDDRLMV